MRTVWPWSGPAELSKIFCFIPVHNWSIFTPQPPRAKVWVGGSEEMSLVPIYQEASGFRMIHQTLLSEFVDVAPLSKLHNSAGTLLIGDSNAPFNACQVVSNIWYLILYPQLSGPQKKRAFNCSHNYFSLSGSL
jgi:hypothetical protein